MWYVIKHTRKRFANIINSSFIQNRKQKWNRNGKGFLYPVHNIITRFQESGEISNVQKSILDARDHQALGQHALKADVILSWKSLHGLRNTSTVHCATRLKLYMQRRSHKLTWSWRAIVPWALILWANGNLKWTEASWKTVLWSEEFTSEKVDSLFSRRNELFALTPKLCISYGVSGLVPQGLAVCTSGRAPAMLKVIYRFRATYAPIFFK